MSSAAEGPVLQTPGTSSAPPSRLPSAECPCNESVETYRGRARKAAAEQDWLGAWRWLGAAASKEEPAPDLVAEQAYVALRAGELATAHALNRHAFAFAADDALRATILFNQGLVEEQRGERVRAAEMFAWSLEFEDRPATRRHLAALPKPDACETPGDLVELCRCNALAFGRDEYLLPAVVEKCDEVARAANGRVIAIEQTLSAWERSRYVMSIELAELRSDGLRRIAELASVEASGALGTTGEVTLDFLRGQRVHGRSIVIGRATEGVFDQNGGGIERSSTNETFDVVCLLGGTLACTERFGVGVRIYYYREENTAAEGEAERWTAVEEDDRFVRYGYTIGADGWLIPKKTGGTLEMRPPPSPVRIW